MAGNELQHDQSRGGACTKKEENKTTLAERGHHQHSRNITSRETSKETPLGWSQLNKDFTKAAEADKCKYLNDQCEKLERFNDKPREVSKAIKNVTEKWNPQTDVINNKNGKDPDRDRRDSEEMGRILRRTLYQNRNLKTTHGKPTGEQRTEPDSTWHEVEIALKHICNSKSPEIDGMAIGMWKAERRSNTYMEAVC